MEVPPGRLELNRILVAHPEIMMVLKFGQTEIEGIPAPAILQGSTRVGFTDVLVDANGVVRRGLLFLDDGTTFYQSFAFLLATKYLEREGRVPRPFEENPDWVRLGKTVFRPLESHDGSYVDADAQGYQFLLDLDRRENAFPTISLGAVLAGDFQPEWFKDQIVLIGVVAEGVKDFFYTSQCGAVMVCPPLSGIELHGFMISQLLRAAQRGQATIATYSDFLETLWIGLWVFGGGLVGVWVRGAWRFSLVVFLGTLGLGGVAVGGDPQWSVDPLCGSCFGVGSQ